MAKFFCYVAFLLPFLFCYGCGPTAQEKMENAILSAQIYLSSWECKKAIALLEENAAMGSSNPDFLITWAASYACKAGFSTPSFFADEVPKFNAAAGLGGFSTFTLARKMDDPDNEQYAALARAVEILLYAGGISVAHNPSASKRVELLGVEKAGDVNSFLLFLILSQMGMYFNYYGNVDDTGAKGEGQNFTNTCIGNYDKTITFSYDLNGDGDLLDPGENIFTIDNLLTVYHSAANKCNHLDSSGHPQLTAGATTLENLIDRYCQGAVLVNNFLDTLPLVITAYAGNDLEQVNAITTEITQAKEVLSTSKAGIASVLNVTGMAKCRTDNVDTSNLQLYFLLIIENLFK